MSDAVGLIILALITAGIIVLGWHEYNRSPVRWLQLERKRQKLEEEEKRKAEINGTSKEEEKEEKKRD